MVSLVISCLGYLVAYPKTRQADIRSKTPTAIYLCYSAFRAALGSVELILPRLEIFMCLIKQHFTVQARCLWELMDVPRVLFCWAVYEHASTPSNSREIYSISHDDAKSALGGVDVGWGVRWALCVWEREVHPAADTLKKTSKSH